MIEDKDYKNNIVQYYNVCWLDRFKDGHNPKSLAMHMGYFSNSNEDNDTAKLAMNEYLVSKLALKFTDDLVIVDAGCGVGGTLFFLEKNFPNLSLIGVNLSSEQITYIEKNKDSNSQLRLLTEDYAKTSIADSSVDVVYGIESVCHAESKDGFYKEAFRILKPGGKLIIIDYLQNELLTDEHTNNLLQNFREGWSVDNYMVRPLELLGRVGFEKREKESIVNKVRPGIEKSFIGANTKMAQMNGNLNPVVKKHLNACISLKKLVDLGEIDYCIISAQKPL